MNVIFKIRRTGSEEANIFQQMIPTVLVKIKQLAASNQDKATIALDIFDDLIECEVGIVIPHIKPMVELCIALAAEQNLDDPLRIKAVTFLGRLTRLKKKTIVKHKLYIPMINVIFRYGSIVELTNWFDMGSGVGGGGDRVDTVIFLFASSLVRIIGY